MYLPLSFRLLFSVTLLVLLWTTSVLAAATVSISSTSDKSYSIQGSGLGGVAGIQLDISYDPSSLSTPTVTQGALVSGAMLTANTNIPGIIKVAIISTSAFTTNGQIATINFATKQGSGGITSAKVSMIDSKGAGVAASAIYSNGSDSTVADTSSIAAVPYSPPVGTKTPGTPTTNTPASSSTTPTYLGTVTLPSDLQQRPDSQPVPSSTAPVVVGEAPANRMSTPTKPSDKPAADSKPEETPQYIVFKGISDRFKQYKGNKTLSAMVAIFDRKISQTISQEPVILLSDGHNKVSIKVNIPARINTSPNFAVNGGKLVSFKQDKSIKGRWTVEVLPDTGTSSVKVTIIAGVEEFEFPLSVAAPVKTTLTFDEIGWNKFLKEVGTAKKPLHDFNNDGVRDYMDEYIFVANHLAKKQFLRK